MKNNLNNGEQDKSPHNEILNHTILLLFFYIDGDIKDIIKIKTHSYTKT